VEDRAEARSEDSRGVAEEEEEDKEGVLQELPDKIDEILKVRCKKYQMFQTVCVILEGN